MTKFNLEKCKSGNKGITLIALIITIIVLLILAGITINSLTGSDSAPAKANEAEQKNDIGSAKDQIAVSAINAKTTAYETAYVGNSVSAGNAATTIGQAVIDAVLPFNGTSTGKASIEVTQAETNSVKGDATITITTRDFEVVGNITINDGILTWGEILPNVPSITLTASGSTTLAPSGTVQLSAEFRKMNSTTLTWSSSNENVATVSSSGLVTVNSNAQNKQTANITATGNGVTSSALTITVEKITIDRVELSPTTLEIEQGESKTIQVTFYDESNSEIPLSKLSNISIAKTSGSDKILVNQDTTNKNKATIAVDSTETTGDKEIVITSSANGTSFTTNVTVTVKVKEAIVGQFVEYNVGYTDISTNASDVANDFEFTPSNGWRILYAEEDAAHPGQYKNVKIISTGVPGGLYYSTTETNNSWWGDGTNKKDKVANGLSTPSKFETIVFNKKTAAEADNASYYNQGYYTQIKHYTSSTPTVINTNDKTAAELFKISNVAAEVDTLTLDELNTALNNANLGRNITARATDSITQISSINDPRSLFYLKGLGNTYNYATDTKNCSYWIASPGPDTSNASRVRYVGIFGGFGSYYSSRFGLRPVVSLSSNVYIKKVGDIWKIFNVPNP